MQKTKTQPGRNKQILRKVQFFSGSSDGKESTCNVGDRGLISGLGSSPGEENDYHPLYYSGLENPHGQRNKSTKLEIKKEKLQLTPQKYQRL